MTIEKDIHQHTFRNEYQKAVINFIYTYNWMNEQMKQFFEPFDITSQQFNILRILRGAAAPLSTLQIRQRMLDKMSDTSRIVDRLVKKGLVKKNVCKSDKRLVDIIISEKGKKLLEEMDRKNEQMDEIFIGISQTEAKKLSQLLDKIRNRAQEAS
jgi:DNA-binding MarR family transcriptional regulator